jgi:hypothetical protein
MATPTIRKQIELPAGVAPSQVTCRLRLVATNDGTDGWGYATGDNVDVAGVRTVTPDATGLVEFTNVRPNSGSSGDQIASPTGTAYELVTWFPSGRTIVEYVDVADAAGPLWVQDILTVAPSAVTSLSGTYVAKAGDTMTGALVVDEANVTVTQPASPTTLEGFYVEDSAGGTVAAYLAAGFILGDPLGANTASLSASGLTMNSPAAITLDADGSGATLSASGGSFDTNGKPIAVGAAATVNDALNEASADGIYLRQDEITNTLAADPQGGKTAIYSQNLAGSALVVVDDHGHRAPVGWDAGYQAQYTRLSPSPGGANATSIGAQWDSLNNTANRNPSAGLPPAWGLNITATDTTAGCNTNIDLVRRGTAGTFGDGWRLTFMVFTTDTITTWTTPGAGAGTRLFVGLSSQTPSTIVGSDDPAGHRAGLSFVNVNGARSDTTFQITTRDGSAETLTDTEMSVAANTVYEVILTQIPGGNLLWQVRNLTADPNREQGVGQPECQGGSISANLPTAYLKAAAALRAVGTPDKSVWMPHLTLTA